MHEWCRRAYLADSHPIAHLHTIMLSLVERLPLRAPLQTCPSALRLLAARPPLLHGLACLRQNTYAAETAGGLLARPRALATLAAVPEAAEDFFAGGTVTFDSLGLAPEVCSALHAAGYPRPAHAQVPPARLPLAPLPACHRRQLPHSFVPLCHAQHS